MHSPDVVTVHLQFWFFLVGFATAVVGLLSRRVQAMFLWPPLLLLLVAPRVLSHGPQAGGDFLLDEMLALAALLIALWLDDQASWRLAGATVFLAAAMSVKREGYLLAACIALAALLVSWRQRRSAWPRLALCAAVAFGLTIPWRLLLLARARDLPGGGPEAGGTGLFYHADRAWPSLRLALSTLFDFDIWLLVGPLAVVAIALALLAGPRSLAGFGFLLFALSIAAFTWTTWAIPSLPITKDAAVNPIARLTGSLAFMATVLVPGLLAAPGRTQRRPRTHETPASLDVLVTAALAYPLAVVVAGHPRFPTRHECVHPARSEGNIEAVFAHLPTTAAAESLQQRATRAGFQNVQVERDGCGLFKVTLHGIPTLAVGRDFVREAQSRGFHPILEQEKP
jgi:hypothetical protein